MLSKVRPLLEELASNTAIMYFNSQNPQTAVAGPILFRVARGSKAPVFRGRASRTDLHAINDSLRNRPTDVGQGDHGIGEVRPYGTASWPYRAEL
jgi:hypothetical protein